MSRYEPKSDSDMDGWHRIPCDTADVIRSLGLKVGASRSTQPPAGTFTEWWSDEFPVMREYRTTHSHNACLHYIAGSPSIAALPIRDDE